MKKQTTKFTKQDKEKIENRLLAIFATALGAEMICLYLINWFRGSAGFMNAARWLCYILMIGLALLAIFLKVKANKFEQQDQLARSKKYTNWFFVCLAGAISALFVWPTQIFGLFGSAGYAINSAIDKFNFFLGNSVCTRILVVMILVGVYTVAAFIYYSILSSQAHKASLHKGNN